MKKASIKAKSGLQLIRVPIYKTDKVFLYMDIKKLKIHLKITGGDERELSFKECVRFIDTRPEMLPSWKKEQILFIASKLGFFGV